MSSSKAYEADLDRFITYLTPEDILISDATMDAMLKAFTNLTATKNPGLAMIDAMLAGDMNKPKVKLKAKVITIIYDDVVMESDMEQQPAVPTKSMKELHAPKPRKRW